ncbi:TetR family transcriptional regulator [Mycobacterium sp. Lab-001]|uniref:TetR family transcriptional regulator n=1 Tax=Mycobacterium sp. Lab-001 TaxID=3410136 RepID=UPI003D163570
MTEGSERRAGTTRHRLVLAASRQFSHRPYNLVSLDDILVEAELTKGAMYFHFPSKQALAMAIIDHVTEMSGAVVRELLARKMSGLETLIDLIYLLAVQDVQDEVARAGLRLLDTLDSGPDLAGTRWQSWVEFVATLIERALSEGDVTDRHEPGDVAIMLVAMWVGVRRISDLDQPEHYLDNLRRTCTLALASFTSPDRTDYFTQFTNRRHALALKKVSTEPLAFGRHATAVASAHPQS